jgi:hypothetical protein
LRRFGSPILLSLVLTASFATVSRAQEAAPGNKPAATPSQPAVTSPSSDPATPAATPAPAPQQVTNTPIATPSSPLALHVGDADITIGGFMDATTVIRSTNPGTGLGTSFGTIPFSNTAAGSLSETRLSAQNSRVTLGASSKAGSWNVKGYLEADFLGAGPTNQFVTSNAATLRMRLYWVQATTGKFEFVAGQSWSLLVPGRNGISPNPGDLFYSQDTDTNYQMGLTWGRTLGYRFVVHPSKVVSAAVAFENPEQYTGGAVVLPAKFTAAEVDGGANTATPNLYPDIIGKLALDPITGKTHQHFEVAGLFRGFKTVDTVTTPFNKFSASGTGVSVDVNLEPVKNLHVIGTGFFSKGGGRYIANTNIPDFVINADSSISTVKSNSWIFGVEDQMMAKTQVFGYYSQASATANTGFDLNGTTPIGFGFAAQAAANKTIKEGTFGITQVFFRDPKIGGMQMMIQYSYLQRTPFSVAAGAPANATANMFFFNIRYILP